MAAAALAKRDSAASKLRDSIRQLQRYLKEGKPHAERIIVQKSDKVDIDREELIAKHHIYGEKSGTSLDDEAMRTYIEEKIDAAVDVVDDATALIERLKSNERKSMEDANKESTEKREKCELVCARLHADSLEKLMFETLTDIDRLLLTSEPTTVDAIKADMYVLEIQSKEEELRTSWNDVKLRLGDDETAITNIIKREEIISAQITQKRVRAKLFSAQLKASEPSTSTSEPGTPSGTFAHSSASAHNIKLQRMKPPTFSGSIRDFARFKADFEKIVESSYSDLVHIVYVMKEDCLHGEALELVRNLENLSDIWERLTEKYGDSIEIVDSVIRDLQSITIPRVNQDQGLINLIETLEKGIQDLTSIGKRSDIANAYTVKLIEHKLPRQVTFRWLESLEDDERTDEDSGGMSRFEKLLVFLKKERKKTERIVQQAKEREKEKMIENKKKVGGGVNMFNKGTTNPKNNCLIHKDKSHLTRKCTDFIAKSADERAKLVEELKACKLCLSISHVGKECPWQPKWQPCGLNGCTEYHSRLLHEANRGLNMHVQVSVTKEEGVDTRTLLLMQEVGDEKDGAFAFWDNGSSITLISKSYARKRNLKGVRVTYDLLTINNNIRRQHTIQYDVPIIDRNRETISIKAYEIDAICDEVAFFDEKVVKLFDNLKIEDVARPKRKVDLLIGMDYISLHPTKKAIRGNLALFNSQFGTGKLLGGRHELIRGTDKMNAFAKIVAYGVPRNIQVEDVKKNIDFFTGESLGISVPPRCNRCKNCKECTTVAQQLSQREQKELEVIRNNLKLDPTKDKWTTSYPFKLDPSILQNNEAQADAFLLRLEKRLLKDKSVCEKYCAQFEDAINRGVYKEVSQEEMDAYKGPVFYITHHEVYKEGSESTPVRIVSNSSLKFNGISFNETLLTGPNCIADLIAVQYNFRTYPVAVVGDIKKMYHSIATTEVERHLRRVKWRSMKLDEEPKTYTTECVQFGDSPAAAITATAIKETANIYEHIDPIAADKIKNDSYVDDFATGADDTEEADTLKANMTKILAKGNLHIKGFVTSGDTSEESRSLLGCGEVGRVVGMGYDPGPDQISVVVRVNLSKKFKGKRKLEDLQKEEIPAMINSKITRRVMLGITYTCYDVFGFLCPITIQLKIILRETYKKTLKLGWDDEVPIELKKVFITVLQVLKEAESFRFRRCISYSNSVGDPELIVFNDGSPLAMCAAAYIRWYLDTDEYVAQLVAAKARVAPLERITVPRVEMNSAVLGVRLAKKIVKSCRSLKFKEVTHIADSKCTIATIAKDSTALKEYMGNRVSEINSNTELKQWLHANSADNIADIGTRMGATAPDVAEDSEWQYPQMLKSPRSEWRVTQDISPEHVPAEELISNLKVCHFAAKTTPLLDLNKVRSYDFAMRVTARIARIFEKKSFKASEVTASCLDKAEKYWIKESMKLTSIEFEKGNLDSLRPRVNEEGIIVLSTRALKGMKLNYNQDTFPILTKSDPLARLWMRKVHFEDHTGITRTVAKSRRKFWIPRARKIAQSLRHSCYVCRLLDKRLEMQQMSPLPESRLAVAPVFQTTSIDLFGPIQVKDTVKKRTTMKVWGFISTCAATRAVHLDITDSYSTDSILQVLRKFTALRGCPAEIISDQGSQLMAASKEIADLTKDWNWTKISSWANDNKIKWKVVPAEGQHQNGLSESLIKSVKRSIAHVIGESVLTFSELQLAFYEIANIVNSRPIGIVSGSDPDEPSPITPNDLLLGRSTNEVPQGPFDTKASITKRFLYVQSLVDDWWKKWYDSVLPSLVPSYKWKQKHRNVKVGDVCLIRYKGIRSTYKLGRVTEVKRGDDGLVRTVRLQYKLPGEKCYRFVDRAVQGIAVIVPIEEQ